LWNSGSNSKKSPWLALTSTSAVVRLQGVPMVKNLTVRSTWTPTAAMPSAFLWPLLVPCAPAGLRRQLTSSLGCKSGKWRKNMVVLYVYLFWLLMSTIAAYRENGTIIRVYCEAQCSLDKETAYA